MIMHWPVTSKPYAIAAEDGKVRSNRKSLFRNHLQALCPQQSTVNPSLSIYTCIVDAMRVVRMIAIKYLNLGQRKYSLTFSLFLVTLPTLYSIIMLQYLLLVRFYLKGESIKAWKGKYRS